MIVIIIALAIYFYTMYLHFIIEEQTSGSTGASFVSKLFGTFSGSAVSLVALVSLFSVGQNTKRGENPKIIFSPLEISQR